ncbi:MAG: OsmC family protein [Lentimicrobiaceae bacterium]|jgi:putative redox protein|nr:OsmC family protein [Lentimicrobiaceae bacterium]MDD4599270.1 OsmC family protein [Lentimicrobiaceae bacterium]MDY0027176.1 OsmC family protein [Lentimicrobium sp.]HAH58918.1 osmotically inducible protein C [Bacteroidales bacterium]
MKHNVNTQWNGNMQFDAVVNGHHLIMDANAEVGGQDGGPRPKELLLAGLAGCTGMDVISILKKMRVYPEYFNIRIEADMTEEHPKHYQSMHIVYEFAGTNLEIEKLNKAVDLSQERYCGVSHMYRKMMTITHEISILDKKLLKHL